MLIKKIFLASSQELREDRREFELMIGQLNQDWIEHGIFFNLVVWENFPDAMAKQGLQQEYDKAVADADIFVMLVFTRVGPYTLEEFNAALRSFQSTGRPTIFVFIKDAVVLTSQIDESIVSLLEFKKQLTDLKHYPTQYRSVEELKWIFSRQLDKLFASNHGLSSEITDSTPQLQIDTIALVLTNRYLSDRDGKSAVNVSQLRLAIGRATELTRHSIFLLAHKTRQRTWYDDKVMMERTLPVFEAVAEADPYNHFCLAQIAYVLKDRVQPDWDGALANLERAINLVGREELDRYPFYLLNRAICAVELDANFKLGHRSDAAARKTIHQDIERFDAGTRALHDVLTQPQNTHLRQWLDLNGS